MFPHKSSLIRKVVLGVYAASALVLGMAHQAVAQDTLLAALKQRYRITEINTQGVAANPGTVLTIEADGINAEPYPTMITFENPVVDGQVKQRSKGLGFLKSTNLQILQPGQKVYITKINSAQNGQNDELKITILTCDATIATFGTNIYNSYQTPKRYSTTLAFKLPKGTLAAMSIADATNLIEAVLSVNPADQVRARDSGTVARSCEPHCAVSSTTGQVVGGAVTAPQQDSGPADAQSTQAQPQMQTQTQTISLGQTVDQVTATLGAPQQIIDLGTKKIYKYPDMKVIFLNGKVSDVQ